MSKEESVGINPFLLLNLIYSQCKYIALDRPCTFCSSHEINEPCIKLWGPKTEESLVIPKPISLLDPSVPCEHLSALQYGYSGALAWFDIRANITQLFLKFASYYGLSISQVALRHAMVACCKREQQSSSIPDFRELSHSTRASQTLAMNLQKSGNVDEGDLFAAGLLALWS